MIRIRKVFENKTDNQENYEECIDIIETIKEGDDYSIISFGKGFVTENRMNLFTSTRKNESQNPVIRFTLAPKALIGEDDIIEFSCDSFEKVMMASSLMDELKRLYKKLSRYCNSITIDISTECCKFQLMFDDEDKEGAKVIRYERIAKLIKDVLRDGLIILEKYGKINTKLVKALSDERHEYTGKEVFKFSSTIKPLKITKDPSKILIDFSNVRMMKYLQTTTVLRELEYPFKGKQLGAVGQHIIDELKSSYKTRDLDVNYKINNGILIVDLG